MCLLGFEFGERRAVRWSQASRLKMSRRLKTGIVNPVTEHVYGYAVKS